MRSYYEHLQMSVDGKKTVASKPTFRSSAIFPVINRSDLSSRILFMGYWILKRHIKQIASIITLRSKEGEVLHRSQLLIEEAKTYRIEVKEQLSAMGSSPDTLFEGTLEVEFFSTAPLFFPYPAVVINYYGPHFCSVVHTAQRVYNDFDDMRNNSQTQVPESGFNLYVDEDHEPFFGLINGPAGGAQGKMSMQFFNVDNESLSYELDLGEQKPYQLNMIYPARHLDLKGFFKGKVGAGKIAFNVSWIFPRLLVGNIKKSLPAISLTHTYYDCSAADSKSDYWSPSLPNYYPASLMIPVPISGSQFTNIYFYPIYSPSLFQIDVEIYNSSGKCLGTKANALVVTSPSCEFKKIDFKALCRELQIPETADLGARVIAQSVAGHRLPARIKLGLDVGQHLDKMPCNICTNLQPVNPAFEGKPSSFRWAPLLADQPDSFLWIMNSSPAISGLEPAEMTLTFFREMDSKTLTRTITVPPHGFVVICPKKEPDLANFFGGQIGWCTVATSNPYTTTYYFANNPSGVVGGDHGF